MAEVVTLHADGDGPGPRFTRAEFLPGRGLMLARLTAALPGRGDFDLVAPSPPPQGTDDYVGNTSFAWGGAFLIPYANRITGAPGPDRTIDVDIAGRPVRLPANWSGKASDAVPYAMHGLILDQTVELVEQEAGRMRGRLEAGDFGGRWLSRFALDFDIRLTPERLSVEIDLANVGDVRAPIGAGWHPYFALPSGSRHQARLHVPAERRLEVGDYDAVLPTGRLLAVAGTDHDFAAEDGRPLGRQYLDDCFVHLHAKSDVVARIEDPAGGVSLTLRAPKPVQAVQVYAPPDQPFVVVEPQFNWADPFGAVWPPGTDTGMVWLEPGERTRYRVDLELSR